MTNERPGFPERRLTRRELLKEGAGLLGAAALGFYSVSSEKQREDEPLPQLIPFDYKEDSSDRSILVFNEGTSLEVVGDEGDQNHTCEILLTPGEDTQVFWLDNEYDPPNEILTYEVSKMGQLDESIRYRVKAPPFACVRGLLVEKVFGEVEESWVLYFSFADPDRDGVEDELYGFELIYLGDLEKPFTIPNSAL